MDKAFTLDILKGLLRNKKALENFLSAHPNLSLDVEGDRAEILKRAKDWPKQSKKNKPQSTTKGLETRHEARLRNELHLDRVLHTAKTLALCSLPYEPVHNQSLVRKATLDDGTTVHVTFTAQDAKIGLPYGKDRALLTWLMTRARDNNTPRVEFKSAIDFFKAFEIARNGKKYHQFRAAMNRICNVTITYGYESDALNAERDRGEKIVYDKNLPRKSDLHAESLGLRVLPGINDPYYVEFGVRTFQDLVANPVTVSLELMKRYQDSPVAWDFLHFISYQAAELHGDEQKAIPLSMLRGFLGSLDKEEPEAPETDEQRSQKLRKLRFKIDGILKDLGPYLPNAKLLGRGAATVLMIRSAQDTLLGTPSHARKTLSSKVLQGDLLPDLT